MGQKQKRWDIWVDTGGTFTDCLGISPAGIWHRVKVLSNSALRGTVKEVLSECEVAIACDWEAPDHFLNGFEFITLGDTANDSSVRIINFNAREGIITLENSMAQPSWVGTLFEARSTNESPVLAARLLTGTPAQKPLPAVNLRLATTRGTNALLERKGASVALFITKGFGDFLKIGTQQRPDLFSLRIEKPAQLYDEVIEIDERVDANGKVLQPFCADTFEKEVERLLKKGISSAAVVGMNSYANDEHEQKLGSWLREQGFEYVSLSSVLSGFVKLLPRAETTLVNAYLAPGMQEYLGAVEKNMGEEKLSVMTSAGGLKKSSAFRPVDGLLSGPAAGVVGASVTGKDAGVDKIISFDMGGTSTDVSRFDGDFEYVFEHGVGDARLMAPAVAIETVAAGGGSLCYFDGHTLRVGPESAGADPGPACYGAGGPLTLTDVNLLAGRLDKRNFHIPLSIEAARGKLMPIVDQVRAVEGDEIGKYTVLEGFLDIANQRMAEAIEKISLRKGYNPKEYTLVSFGGAGGQHGCGIAQRLEIDNIIIPGDAGLLSAYGLGHAVKEHFENEQILEPLDHIEDEIENLIERLSKKAHKNLAEEEPDETITVRRKLLFLRLKGQESTLEIEYEPELNLSKSFQKAYENRYGHWVDDDPIEVESARVVVSSHSKTRKKKDSDVKTKPWEKIDEKEILLKGKMEKTPVYDRKLAKPGSSLVGPALVMDPYSTIFIDTGWQAEVGSDGSLMVKNIGKDEKTRERQKSRAVALELFTHRFTSIAEKMGEMLQRTARSVNVKERQDFSCALLDRQGQLVVNAPHIPVHLGALGLCVRRLQQAIEMRPGDVIVTNHPAYGGSHLPDVTVVTPVFASQETLVGYVASRAHHAEIGGTRPGSMPPDATCLAGEGVVIPPTYLFRKGQPRLHSIREMLMNAPYPTRNVDENMADLQAQMAANEKGRQGLGELVDRHGLPDVQYYMNAIKERAAQLMQETIQNIPNGRYHSCEYLDDGTPLAVEWKVQDTSVGIDFTGTGEVHPQNLNATPAIVNSVVMYVLRVLINQPIPLNEGLLNAVTLTIPSCLLNPDFPNDPQQCPAVVGGNIEVSQRLTDTLLKPFERIACGQGTMNNILFGNDSFGYYETVGGGSGAGRDFDGADAVHQHMTNTRGTDPEIFEQRYPVRLNRYAIRKESGGQGAHRGGNGIIREMTFLEPVKLSVLTQHRVQAPYGLKGGEPGKKGKQWIVHKNGKKEFLQPSDARDLLAGDRFILCTPGGGGFGKAIIKSN